MKLPFLMVTFLCCLTASCIHPQVKFQKRALLDPIMTTSKGLSESIITREATVGSEKAGLSEAEGSLGSNCPTCG